MSLDTGISLGFEMWDYIKRYNWVKGTFARALEGVGGVC